MTDKISMSDIAARAGVSVSTVSHVLNKTRFVSPEITERVNRIVRETGYQQNMLARAMRQGKTHTVGIILPSISYSSFYSVTLGAIEKGLGSQGYSLIIQASGNDEAQEQDAIRHLLGWNVDGMIITPANNDYDYSSIPCPVVLMDREPNKKTVNGFYVDNYTVSCQAMRRLLAYGHTRIGFMGAVPHFSRTVNRLKGYRDVLTEAGLPVREAYIRCGETTASSGAEMVRSLMEETDVTALLITSNPLTVGAIGWLNAHGVRIPQQVAIVSFGNYEWMPLCSPPLDGVVQPNREIGERVAARMLQLLNDPSDTRVITEYLPCEYVKGRSIVPDEELYGVSHEK